MKAFQGDTHVIDNQHLRCEHSIDFPAQEVVFPMVDRTLPERGAAGTLGCGFVLVHGLSEAACGALQIHNETNE
jgi:hypothetical protein